MDSTLDNHQDQSRLRQSDDVKEVVLLATKYAKKGKRPQPTDRDYFRALLVTNRAFTHQDAVLKKLDLSPSRLHKELQNSANVLAPASSARTLQRAEAFARENTEQTTLQTEHILKALTESRDPVVASALSQVTPLDVDQASAASRSGSLPRQIAFIARELAEVIIFVLFFLVLIRSLLGEPRLIPSESMLPLLQVNDRVIVERVSHWYRPYHRGDVLVFYPPMTTLKNDPWSVFLRLTGFSGLLYKKEDNIDVAYIKRIIGMPGDRLEVRPGIGVFVNGQKLNEPYISEVSQTCTLVQPITLCQPITVPENSYFMMGDNRNQSADSRYWGFEPTDRVIGRAVFRIWPMGRIGMLPSPEYEENKNNQ